jgi:cell cycle arrest protein BUB3
MSIANHNLVVGTANRKVMVWDLRNMAYPQQKRESNLKYQTRALCCSPDGQGFVLSSIEGRVSVEYLDHSAESLKKKYAFKCHRIREGSLEYIYPINAIEYV